MSIGSIDPERETSGEKEEVLKNMGCVPLIF
jgi:hypothetical protein